MTTKTSFTPAATCYATRDHDPHNHADGRCDGTAIPTELVPVSALRDGDVVRTNGMRVLLDRPIRIRGFRGDDIPVHFTRGLVLTPEAEVRAAGIVPWSWLFENRETEPRWTVQSNARRSWVREVA